MGGWMCDELNGGREGRREGGKEGGKQDDEFLAFSD